MKRILQRALVISLWGMMPSLAFAHGGHDALGTNPKPHDVAELLHRWEFDPLVIIGLAVGAILYWRGVMKLRRAMPEKRGIGSWEMAAFVLGWLSIVVALVSPLHPWGRVLFSAHMTQHEILMLVAAPLLVLGRPLLIFLVALPRDWSRALARAGKSRGWQKIWSVLSNAFFAFAIHGIALWVWHIPSWFQATIDNNFVHALQHTSFLFSALLFWWALMQGKQRMSGYGLAVLYMFLTAMHSGLLGALLTFTTSVWYPAYRETSGWWGMTALEDQQLGGLIMWIPAGLVYIIAGVALFAGWLREAEARINKNEELAFVTSQTQS